MSAADAPVIAEVRNYIGHVTLNRPAGLNALTLEMVELISSLLESWRQDDQVRAVVLRAAGEKAFCAGGDIRSLYESYQAGNDLYLAFFEREYDLDLRIHHYSKPILALMDGFVLGGGMGLVQGAALRVVSERVRMGMPETGIGYFPDVGGSYFLSRLPGRLGEYLGVTGRHLPAADALYAGLADYCLPAASFSELDHQLDRMAFTSNISKDLQSLIDRLRTPATGDSELACLQEAIDEHFSKATIEEVRSSLAAEQRPAFAQWARTTLDDMESRSTLAMGVTLELIRRGRELTLEDCFALELHLDRQWFAQGDIVEGVRALLIDKDKSPKWNPSSFEELDQGRIDAFFKGFSLPGASSHSALEGEQ